MARLVIGTRGSLLARTQSEWVAAQLRAQWPDCEVVIEHISTRGDKIRDVPLAQIGGKGLFTKELEIALLDGRIDLAVHSLKDLPTELPDGLALGAVPVREDPRDALVSRGGARLDQLPRGARVGTSSLRRRLQLIAVRPDLDVVDLRGNVPTRLRRVSDGDLDAAVLAAAGLRRLGETRAITQELPPGIMLSAVGQGALGIEIRAGDERVTALLSFLHDDVAAAETTAERSLLAALGGGCQTPVGALGRAEGERLRLYAGICDPDGGRVLRTEAEGRLEDAEALGQRAAEVLLGMGAAAFVQRAAKLGLAAGKPLSGKRIVVTRAQSQASDLVQALEDLGASTFAFATIEMKGTMPETWPAPAPADWVVFTSVNGVKYFFESLAMRGLTLGDYAAPRVCAIGPATAAEIEQRDIAVDLVAKEQAASGVLAALLEREGDFRGKRFLLPRGNLAKSGLPGALREGGAETREIVVYETLAPRIPEETVEALMAFEPDVIVFTSSSTVKHFCARLQGNRLETLKSRAVFASIGPVTTKTARECGLDVQVEPSQYDVPALLRELTSFFTS